MDADPLVPTPRDTGADPDIAGSGGTSTSGIRQPSRATCASTRFVDVLEGGSVITNLIVAYVWWIQDGW